MFSKVKTKIMILLFIIIVTISCFAFGIMVYAKENINNTQEKNIESYKESNSTDSNKSLLFSY